MMRGLGIPSGETMETELHSFNRHQPLPHRDNGLSSSYANRRELAEPSIVHDTDVTRAEKLGDGELGSLSASTDPKRTIRRTFSHLAKASFPSPNDGPGSNTENYDIPDNYANLGELGPPEPIETRDEYRLRSLEEVRNQEHDFQKNEEQERRLSTTIGEEPIKQQESRISSLATQLYVISYLILFSFLGTLARLGIQAITVYPGAPVVFGVLWANFAGCLIMGILSEDRMLFKEEWGTPTYRQDIERARQQGCDGEHGSSEPEPTIDLQVAKKEHVALKKTIPLYIGLTTGFCGCFTSFSSFVRDVYLALSNDLPTPLNHPANYGPLGSSTTPTVPRNGGYSFMALLAVIITTVCLCVSGLYIGAHIAMASQPYTPSIPFAFCRKVVDRVVVFLGWGCWFGAILLAIFPPDRHESPPEIWRGRAVFALIFAPLGCLGRFYASLYLNGRIASFPLGTFAVNIFGTAILGMSYDLQHVPLGDIIGCQVLQGIEDGFCGCLTTVSTWVNELSSLRRTHAYIYGAASIGIALCFLIVIMGSMQWTIGFSALRCTH
jgi:CrcB protein